MSRAVGELHVISETFISSGIALTGRTGLETIVNESYSW